MVSLKQLRYFSTVARTGHFGAAAEQCAVTQPALSMRIQELEKELGLQLLERGRKGVGLTAGGREIAGRAACVLADVRAHGPILALQLSLRKPTKFALHGGADGPGWESLRPDQWGKNCSASMLIGRPPSPDGPHTHTVHGRNHTRVSIDPMSAREGGGDQGMGPDLAFALWRHWPRSLVSTGQVGRW